MSKKSDELLLLLSRWQCQQPLYVLENPCYWSVDVPTSDCYTLQCSERSLRKCPSWWKDILDPSIKYFNGIGDWSCWFLPQNPVPTKDFWGSKIVCCLTIQPWRRPSNIAVTASLLNQYFWSLWPVEEDCSVLRKSRFDHYQLSKAVQGGTLSCRQRLPAVPDTYIIPPIFRAILVSILSRFIVNSLLLKVIETAGFIEIYGSG